MTRKYFKYAAFVFGFLGIIFIPFPLNFLPGREKLAEIIFNGPISLLSRFLFGHRPMILEISSDSATLYLLVFFLFILSLIISGVSLYKVVAARFMENAFPYLQTFFTYFLAIIMLKYGLDKIFKTQFYLPEPNILYTPIGNVSKDLLFWSTMGSSYGYNLFIGLAELIPAVFLFFRPTRRTGLILAFLVLIHITAINFCFDISVKVFSVFLLAIATLLLVPVFKPLFQFLSGKKDVNLQIVPVLVDPGGKKWIIKGLTLALILGEGLFPYLGTGNFNDDDFPRPFLHGGYEVTRIDNLSTTSNEELPSLKRFFIHRSGYIVFQDANDEMQDFHLDIDKTDSEFILTDYELKTIRLKFEFRDNILKLHYFGRNSEFLLTGRELDWRALPLLRQDFHWSIDEIN